MMRHSQDSPDRLETYLGHGSKKGEVLDGARVGAHHRYDNDVDVWSRAVTAKVHDYLEVALVVGGQGRV